MTDIKTGWLDCSPTQLRTEADNDVRADNDRSEVDRQDLRAEVERLRLQREPRRDSRRSLRLRKHL